MVHSINADNIQKSNKLEHSAVSLKSELGAFNRKPGVHVSSCKTHFVIPVLVHPQSVSKSSSISSSATALITRFKDRVYHFFLYVVEPRGSSQQAGASIITWKVAQLGAAFSVALLHPSLWLLLRRIPLMIVCTRIFVSLVGGSGQYSRFPRSAVPRIRHVFRYSEVAAGFTFRESWNTHHRQYAVTPRDDISLKIFYRPFRCPVGFSKNVSSVRYCVGRKFYDRIEVFAVAFHYSEHVSMELRTATVAIMNHNSVKYLTPVNRIRKWN